MASSAQSESAREAAREWVEKAIACRSNPVVIQHSARAIEPGRYFLQESLVDEDLNTIPDDVRPDRFPDELWPFVFEVLDGMGRVKHLSEEQLEEVRRHDRQR